MASPASTPRQRLLLVLGVLLNVGAVVLAALAALRGDWTATLWWVAVALGWLVLLRLVLGTSTSTSAGD